MIKKFFSYSKRPVMSVFKRVFSSPFFTNNKINYNSMFFTNKKMFSDLGKDNTQNFSEQEALEIIEAGVFEVLKGAAKCKVDKLSRAASFQDLGFDSLDQVELVVALEEKFNINITGILYFYFFLF